MDMHYIPPNALISMTDGDFPLQQPATRLIRSPYRTLGLPANASLADMQHAIETFSQALATARSPITRWDTHWIGDLQRMESDLYTAYQCLIDPVQRLFHRLLWFHQGSMTLANLPPTSAPIIAADWARSDKPARVHDGALLCLLRAELHDPAMHYTIRWQQALYEWQWVIGSEEYWALFCAIERESDFSPQASPEMLQAFRAEALSCVTDSLYYFIDTAYQQADYSAYRRGLSILRAEHLSTKKPRYTGWRYDSTAAQPVVLPKVTDEVAVSNLPFITPPPLQTPPASSEPTDIPDDQSAHDMFFGQISVAAKILHDIQDLLPAESRVRQPLEESRQKIELSIVLSFEDLCAEFVLKCRQRATGEKVGVSHSGFTTYEEAMQYYEREINPQLEQVLTLVGAQSYLAQRARESAQFCLYYLMASWPWDQHAISSNTLLTIAREHFPANSPALRRLEESMDVPEDTPPAEEFIEVPPEPGRFGWCGNWQSAFMGAALLILITLVFFVSMSGGTRHSSQLKLADLEMRIQQDGVRIVQLQSRLQLLKHESEELATQITKKKHLLDIYEKMQKLGVARDDAAYSYALNDYSSLLPTYNSKLTEQNQVAADLQQQMREHNKLVADYNAVQGKLPMVHPLVQFKAAE